MHVRSEKKWPRNWTYLLQHLLDFMTFFSMYSSSSVHNANQITYDSSIMNNTGCSQSPVPFRKICYVIKIRRICSDLRTFFLNSKSLLKTGWEVRFSFMGNPSYGVTALIFLNFTRSNSLKNCNHPSLHIVMVRSHIYTHTHMHTPTHTHKHTHTHTHTHTNTHTPTHNTQTHTHTRAHTPPHTRTHPHPQTHTHTHTAE
jgi:hypothetical protein